VTIFGFMEPLNRRLAIAKILYKNAPTKELTSLGKIEEVVRSQMQEHVMPEVGGFLSKMSQEKTQDTFEL
jgi:hypothetical protein